MKRYFAVATAALTLACATSAAADGNLTFVIVGDTFSQPFTITNASTAGEAVVGFGMTLVSPYGFDTDFGGFGSSPTAFAPFGGTEVTTGYTGPASFADGSTSIAFTFNDFTPGESFSWIIDVDHPDFLTVLGSDLIGSTGYADFSNGLRGLGVFEALGTDGAQFRITTFTPTPGIPEPGTWALMISGLGLIGAALRRRGLALA